VPVRIPCHADTGGPDRVRRREFEDVRAGTVSWYGVQDVATGAVTLQRATTRMTSEAFTMVLDDLVAVHGEDFTIIMDNGAAHTSGHTRRWIDHHPGVRVLLTPFHASWANPVQVVFSVLTRQVITDGYFTSGDDLDEAAQQWTQLRNRHPHPVRWSYQRRGPGTSDPEH
jgi:transposase InsO family protein